MNYQDLQKLNGLVSKVANTAFLQEKLPVVSLAAKAKKIAEAQPHDSTCLGMHHFLSKRATNYQKPFVTRGELRDVYNRLYVNSTKFGQYFQEELGLEKPVEKQAMRRNPKENEMISELSQTLEDDFDSDTYSVLAEELGSALKGKESLASYTAKIAQSARKACARELNVFGLLPKNLSVVAGQEDVLLCEATYDTPKGLTSVLIPVEVKSGLALPPGMFLSTAGFIKLNSDNLHQHLKETSGKTYQVDPKKLLAKISEVKNPVAEKDSVTQIVDKVAARRGHKIQGSPNDILLTEIDPKNPNVELPQLEPTGDVKSIAEHLNSNQGAAEFVFGRESVEKGRNLVAFEVKKAGWSHPQIVVDDSQEDSVTYAVNLDNKNGFRTKVKFAQGNPTVPKVVVAHGSVFDFSPQGLSQLVAEGESEPDIVAQTSAQYGLKPSELLNEIRAALQQENLEAASDALHVLKQSGDEYAYRTGYDLYLRGLQGDFKKEASTSCSHPVKLGSTQKTICSHTGLPLDKVYQDKYGNCQPLYRRNIEETSTEGVSTISSRIYFE